MTSCPIVLILLGAEHRRSVWKIAHDILLGKPRILTHVILKMVMKMIQLSTRILCQKGLPDHFLKSDLNVMDRRILTPNQVFYCDIIW